MIQTNLTKELTASIMEGIDSYLEPSVNKTRLEIRINTLIVNFLLDKEIHFTEIKEKETK